MIKLFAKFLVFSSIFVFCFSVNMFSQSEVKIIIIKKDAVLRVAPSQESEIIRNLPLGLVLECIETYEDWIKTVLPPNEEGLIISGYIHNSFLKFEVKSNQIRGEGKIFPNIKNKSEYKWEKSNVFGLKMGISFSNINVTGEDSSNFEWKSIDKLTFGCFLLSDLNEYIALQIEGNYVQRGGKHEHTILGTDYKAEYKGSYIEMPVLLKIKILTQQFYRPYFLCGPSLALQLNSKIKSGISGYESNEDYISKSVDFGVTLGGGIEFKSSSSIFTLEARYNFGLSDLYEPSENEDIHVKTNTIALLAGIGF